MADCEIGEEITKVYSFSAKRAKETAPLQDISFSSTGKNRGLISSQQLNQVKEI